MRKRFLIILICLFFVIFFSTRFIKVTALTDDTNKASYEITTTKSGTVNGTKAVFFDEYGKCEGKDIHVTMLTQMCDIDNNKTKIVSWAVKNSTNDGFKKQNVAQICADYEKNHPGWIVSGGINADQYTLGYGNGLGTNGKHPYSVQPYYPFVCDNQKYFSRTWRGEDVGSSGRFVGFTNDGSQDQLVLVQATTAKTQFVIEILDDEGQILYSQNIDSLNGTGETVVYTGYYSDTSFGVFLPKTINKQNTFIVENADLAYCNNYSKYTNVEQAQDAFYGIGKISKIGDLETKNEDITLNKKQFAVYTTNTKLKEKLTIGTKIRCQYNYIDEKNNNFESTIGFHKIQRNKGADISVTGSYNTGSRPRSVFGRKDNGNIVLMTIDDYNETYGVTGYGINAICKTYGIVEAYQMDGGGSAQMAVRQSDGTFKGVTYSDDYKGAQKIVTNQRSVFSALLFVVRDPSIVDEYNVSYDFDGGIYSDVELTGKYTKYNDLVLPKLVKEGYVFDNWYLDDKYTTKISRNIKGDINLYARFYYLGDADENGVLDLKDCILLRMYYSGILSKTTYIKTIFDMNQDSSITNEDILLLQEQILKQNRTKTD